MAKTWTENIGPCECCSPEGDPPCTCPCWPPPCGSPQLSQKYLVTFSGFKVVNCDTNEALCDLSGSVEVAHDFVPTGECTWDEIEQFESPFCAVWVAMGLSTLDCIWTVTISDVAAVGGDAIYHKLTGGTPAGTYELIHTDDMCDDFGFRIESNATLTVSAVVS